jgi:DNA topoisomerase-2
MGGSDSASARYIHTELMPIARALVKKEDDAILTYMDDDGLFVEPETYYPVIPLILVNGALGIGTGFSTNILPHNPKDLVSSLKKRLSGETVDLTNTDLTPWWFGFKGKVQQGADTKTWLTKGVYEFVSDDQATIRITELPIGTWTQDYKDFLETLLTDQETAKNEYANQCRKAKDAAEVPKPVTWLKSYEALYNDVDVDFVLYMDPDYYHEARAYSGEFETRFKLNSKFKTTNMVAFDANGLIHRFDKVGEIMEMFYGKRLAKYGERKAHELDRLAKEIVELSARLTFVKAVVEKRLIVANAEDDELLKALQSLSLPALSEGEGLKGYEYLLKMRVDRLKASAVKELEAEVDAANVKSEALKATKPETLWLNDLDMFEKAWDDYSVWRNGTYESSGATPSVKKKIVRKVKAKGVAQ